MSEEPRSLPELLNLVEILKQNALARAEKVEANSIQGWMLTGEVAGYIAVLRILKGDPPPSKPCGESELQNT